MKRSENSISERICKPLSVPNMSLYSFLLHRNPINASKTVCRCHDEVLLFKGLKIKSGQCAKALLALGVQKGDIVPICSEPSIAAIVVFFALNRIGAISCFLNSTASVEEINGYLRKFESKTFVISSNCYSKLHQMDEKLEPIDHVICMPSIGSDNQMGKMKSV